MPRPGVNVDGLTELVRGLKGPLFRDVNASLREQAPLIAEQLVPHVESAVRQSRAHQAQAMSHTVRSVRDRVPVVVIGKTNPKFRASTFTRRGSRRDGGARANPARRRGALAHGVVKGPAGGRRDRGGNYYGIPRDDTGGPVGRALDESGSVMAAAVDAYREMFYQVLDAHGWKVR